ncbi:MAG: ABC transporter substrate-binding protein [Dermatophilaceae bacterium]
MSHPRRATATASVAAAGILALALASCSAAGTSGTSGGTAGGIKTGPGVTKEPCPKAVDKTRGCIYLGVLSDLSEGPFAALAVPITDAQRAYWKKVNESGGISGYEVDIDTYTKDTKYQAAEHAKAYQQIKSNILALAQTLGTVNTAAILPDMDASDIVGVPASWWSGYHFADAGKGLILANGYSYCSEAVVGLDWYSEKNAKPTSVAAVGYPGDYGGDSAAGVKLWAEANGVSKVTVVATGPNQTRGNQDAVVSALAQAAPDVVVLAVGPAENAEIIGKLVAGGFKGRFMGSAPTWNPALLQSAAAPAISGRYHNMAMIEQWDGTSAAIAAMKSALGGQPPKNNGYVIGWSMNYPMHAALVAAAKAGDLTRAGVRKAVNGLVVTWDGMASKVTYGGNGKSVADGAMIVSAPDAATPLGLKSTGGFYTGTTFAKLPYDKPCSTT